MALFRIGMLLAGFCMSTAAAAAAAGPTAETVYQHGTVNTIDGAGTVAQALAISEGRIVYVGSDVGVQPLIGKATKVVDLGGRTIMPGLIDGHMHPVAAGLDLLKCNLNYAALTLAQFRARIQGCLDEHRNKEGPDSWLEVVNWFRYAMGPDGANINRHVLDSLKTQ